MAAKARRVDADLAALARLERAALRERWRTLYGAEAPARLSPEMLRKAIAYRLQETAFGGLKPATRKRLRRIAEGSEAVGEGPRALKPGTTLVRQWHGETHEVWVLEIGYAWRGGHYRSLSRIAREITGAQWNGPAFFGLRSSRVMEGADG